MRWSQTVCAFILAVLIVSSCGGDEGLRSGDIVEKSPYRVGVYYYPWYGSDFHGGKYMRARLVPPQYPTLGEYDDREVSVISQHLAWSRQAHISLWVASWWGPDRREDQTLSYREFYLILNWGIWALRFFTKRRAAPVALARLIS